MPKTETIDITPRGMQTPEGSKRVNEALNTYEDAVRGLAAAAALFIEDWQMALIEMVSSESMTETSIRDDWKQLRELHVAYRRKHDALIRAVAGMPPQN